MKHFLLTAFILLSLCAQAKIFSGDCGDNGDNVKWTLDDSTGKLTITGSGNMYWLGYAPWSSYSDEIKSVTIGNGVTCIEDFAFQYCYYLKSVEIPASVAYIGEFAFARCYALEEVKLPYGVTYIGNSTFYYCYSLKSIELPGSLRTIDSSAFRYCSALTGLKLPNGLNSIGYYAFQGCTNLVTLTIPGSVKSIDGYAFSSCENLISVDMEEGVESLGEGAFSYNKNLLYIEVPASVSSMAPYTFYDCPRLQVVRVLGLTPVKISDNCFSYTPQQETAILFIARPAIEAYGQATGWKNFAQVIAIRSGVDFMVDGVYFDHTSSYYGESVTLPDFDPEKEGYTFTGWADVPPITPSYDIVIHATFAPDNALPETRADETESRGGVYTVDGKLLYKNMTESEAKQTLKPGIYIINGKKIAVQ